MGQLYKEFLDDGRKYLKTARGGLKRPSVFTETILYNILAMAIEKTIMGILVFHGDMADNHTFSDLLDSLKRVMDVDETLAADLQEFELYQTICSPFDGYQRKKMSFDVIARMMETATLLENHAAKSCPNRYQ